MSPEFLQQCLEALQIAIPSYTSNGMACVLGGGKPLDMGVLFIDKRRLLGDGKTIRGTVLGPLMGTLTGYFIGDFLKAFVLSVGAVIGDIVGSFIKRRLNIEKGGKAPVLDQYDFLIGALTLYSIFYPLNRVSLMIVLVVTPIAHVVGNLLAYTLKFKDVPW